MNDIIYCQIQAKNPIYLTQLGYEQNQPIPLSQQSPGSSQHEFTPQG